MNWYFSVCKKNGKLIFKDYGGYQTRNFSTSWCIIEANKIYNWKDFKEIQIYTYDYEKNENQYTYSKINSYKNLVPDFNFHAWPQVGIEDYEIFVNDIHNAGLQKYEVNKVGWIGNSNCNKNRVTLLEIGNNNKDLFDFFDCGNWWKNPDSIKLNNKIYISTPDLVKKYSILIDIEGNGYSGRLKHLLWSHRPLLIVNRCHREYFFEYLKPWEHFIPVHNDLSDLLEKTKWCMENPEKANEIAENAYQFSLKYLTRLACYEKWNNIITNL